MPLTRTVNLKRLNKEGTNTTNLDPISYNDRYPGLDEYNYKKLESKIDKLGLTGYDREKAMDEAYVQVIPLIQTQIKNSDRRKYINQAKYEASQIEDPSARFQANAKLGVTELTQLIKEKYNVDPSANDEEVFNSWMETIPNGGQLLADYMNNGDRELLYAGGLETKVEAPAPKESSVGGMQSIINKQSETESDSTLGKINNSLDNVNLIGKVTQGIDNLVQKIPTLTYDKQVENLANKMNNLTEDEIADLYQKYTAMIDNGTDEKWNNDNRSGWELFWDAITGDKDALDRINTLQVYDYSEAMPQDRIEQRQIGTKIIGDKDLTINEDDNLLDKVSKKSQEYSKNLLNFIGGSWGGLENYAEALGVGLQKMKDIGQNRTFVPQDLKNNKEAFEGFVADKVANFGEYMTDAPDTLMGRPVDPNVVKFFTNMPQSFIKTLSSQIRGKTNPLDSKVGLLKMLFTEEGQQAMIDRYGSIENIANTMNTDPVGLADDMLDWADKLNAVVSGVSGGKVPRENIGSVVDALSNETVNGINNGLTKVSNWARDNGFNRTSNLINLERDVSMNPSKIKEDTEAIAKQGVEDVVNIAESTAKKIGEISDSYKEKSAEVREKAKDLPTRTIPEKIVENDLKLTPKERERVEKSGITAANFVLKEKIAGLDNEDKIVALQDISSDAYNNITDTFKNKIPSDYREKSAVASKMLNTMVNAMESSDIVKEEYGDYINKLKEMAQYEDYSPYEKLAIRRDFDAIVGNDLFKKDGALKGDFENGIIAGWRSDLNDEINKIGKQYGVDVKDENSRISNAITIRDGLIRSVSQGKKNNYLGLQDLGIGAILAAGDPVQAGGIMIAKKVWDAKSGKVAQSMYNMNSNPLKPANTKKGSGFIKKSNGNASNRFMISTISDNTTSS